MFLEHVATKDPFSAMGELYVVRPMPSFFYGKGNLELAGNMQPGDQLTDFLESRDTLKVAIIVDAIRDANRLLQGKEKLKRDKKRAAERSEDRDMLLASR